MEKESFNNLDNVKNKLDLSKVHEFGAGHIGITICFLLIYIIAIGGYPSIENGFNEKFFSYIINLIIILGLLIFINKRKENVLANLDEIYLKEIKLDKEDCKNIEVIKKTIKKTNNMSYIIKYSQSCKKFKLKNWRYFKNEKTQEECFNNLESMKSENMSLLVSEVKNKDIVLGVRFYKEDKAYNYSLIGCDSFFGIKLEFIFLFVFIVSVLNKVYKSLIDSNWQLELFYFQPIIPIILFVLIVFLAKSIKDKICLINKKTKDKVISFN